MRDFLCTQRLLNPHSTHTIHISSLGRPIYFNSKSLLFSLRFFLILSFTWEDYIHYLNLDLIIHLPPSPVPHGTPITLSLRDARVFKVMRWAKPRTGQNAPPLKVSEDKRLTDPLERAESSRHSYDQIKCSPGL